MTKNRKSPYHIIIVTEPAKLVTHNIGVDMSFWWRIIGRNGQIVATSETYDSAGNCRRAARKFAVATGLEIVEKA